MPEERARILELLREGKISVDEAEELLDALGAEPVASSERPKQVDPRTRRLHVRITDLRTGRVKTDVKLPAGAWNLISKLPRTKLGRYIKGVGFAEIERLSRAPSGSHIVDVTDEHRGERVEVFFE